VAQRAAGQWVVAPAADPSIAAPTVVVITAALGQTAIMSSEFDPNAWAAAEAERLRTAAKDRQYNASSGGGWAAAAPLAKEAQAEASGALEFLRRLAGDGDLYRAAREGLETKMRAHEYLERLARILDQFVAGRTAGLLKAVPFEVSARVEAATDLMEQVEQLLSDRTVHVAAPIVLAGAALEELLRSMWHQIALPALNGRPGINSYATALKEAKVLDKQDVKDVTAWAGLRNDAAHGDFAALDLPRARIMADGINLFMQRHGPRLP